MKFILGEAARLIIYALIFGAAHSAMTNVRTPPRRPAGRVLRLARTRKRMDDAYLPA
jgi:hypothetical protein